MSQHLAFLYTLIPFDQERAVPTNSTLCSALLPALLGYYVMATLVQLPRTKLLRAALLPVVLWFAVRAGMTLDLSQKRADQAYANHGLALAMFTLGLRIATWTLADKPYVRLLTCGVDSAVPKGTSSSNDLSSALWNAWDLCCNFRGFGWNWSQGVQFPSPMFETNSRLIFVGLSLGRCILYLVTLGALELLLRSFAPPGPAGWSIFDPSLSPLPRYLQSTIITWLAGFAAYFAIKGIYQLIAMVFTILFQQQPQQWPPICDKPWSATSLSRFWGRQWHQIYRESFMAVACKPLEGILGKYAVLGAFVTSGVLHDVGLRGMDRGGHSVAVTGFFVMQGVGVLLERVWRRLTGRPVGGVFGWLWVWAWLTVWGNLLVEAWAETAFLAKSKTPSTVLSALQ